MSSPRTKPASSSSPREPISRERVLAAAAAIGCDPRLAERILKQGPTAARNRVHRERAAEYLGTTKGR